MGLEAFHGGVGTEAIISTCGYGRAAAALMLLIAPAAAEAFDEIQVYNEEIAEVGQWTIQQHLNYAFKLGQISRKPDRPK